MSASTYTVVPTESYSQGDLDDLQAESTRVAVVAVVFVAIGLYFVTLIFLGGVKPEQFLIQSGLAFIAWIAHRAFHWGARAAGIALVSGLVVIVTLGLFLISGNEVAPWFGLVVLLAGTLLGWRHGALTAVVVSGILILVARQFPNVLASSVATSTVLLCLACPFVSWLTSRPTQTAIEWAWESYQQALQRMIEARERQGELGRLSKSLSESYHRLEQLNLELERARRMAQEAHRLKAQFAASVSHELRTPLNLIIGFCEMMVLAPTTAYGQRLPEKYRGDLEAIYRNACHLSALVDDILDLSQVDADRMALHKEWTQLNEVVDEAVATVETLFRDQGLGLRVMLPDDLPPLYIDRIRVRQVIINLLSNAARYVHKGGATVWARLDDREIVVGVSDTGPGIPPSELASVFEEFHRVGDGGRRRGSSGLGLAVSKRFVELHGGTMWVESTVGVGTTFSFSLPLTENVVPGATSRFEERVRASVRGTPERRVLVLDETNQIRRILERYLDGYRVLALTDITPNRPLDDVDLPNAVVIGADEAREQWSALLRASPELQRTPVISCTFRTAYDVNELGVFEYLTKPVSRNALRVALRRLPRTARNVLVVDDDEDMLRLLQRMVRSIGRAYNVLTAENGARALEVLREHRPDVVILDLLMPVMDGYGVIEAMEADPELRRIPVIAVTARGRHDETVIVNELRVTRGGGLTVAEAIRWLRSGLDALLEVGTSAPTRPATSTE